MARPLRIEYPGAVYHVTSRGNEKKKVFKDDKDREAFLNTLYDVNKRYNWLCHAYCLMDNHYHLLIETPDGNLSAGMRQLNGVYTQLFNKRHKRVGHLFQGRYKAILIQKDSHLLEVSRYIVLNPLRARMVESPEVWKWGSYGATAGTVKSHPCITRDWILGQFNSKIDAAEKAYRRYVKDGIDKESILKEVKGQIILGEANFTENFTEYIKGRGDIAEIPKSQRYINRPSLEEIFNITKEDKQNRNKRIIEAVERHGYSQKEISGYLGLHYTSISRIVNER